MSVFPSSSIDSAAPGLILFLQIAAEAQTRVETMRPAQALQRLLPNSLLASQAGVSAQHFNALAQLALALKVIQYGWGAIWRKYYVG